MRVITQNELREAVRIVAEELGYTDDRGNVLPHWVSAMSFVELVIRRAYGLDGRPAGKTVQCGVCGLTGTLRVFDRDDCPGLAGCHKVEDELRPKS